MKMITISKRERAIIARFQAGEATRTVTTSVESVVDTLLYSTSSTLH